MANLTGEYDVVAEVGVGLVNAVLATVHQNRNTSFPTMPHSINLWIDDSPRGPGDPVPATERTGIRSVVELQASTPTLSLPVDTEYVRPDVGNGDLTTIARVLPGGIDVRDVGDLVFTPGLEPADYPKVTARVAVRAWVRDTTDPALPEFLHGDLDVTAGLIRSDVPGVGTFLTIERAAGPAVSFRAAPGTQVTDEQQAVVAGAVRNFIRSEMDPATFRVSLPDEVRRFDFLLQPEASRPSILLMLTLSDRVLGPGARRSVAGGWLPAGADFAIAVGRDYVADTMRANLFQGLPSSYSGSSWGVSATLRPDWAGATFDLQPGRIVFTVNGDGHISWWGVGDDFTFTVQQAFVLEVAGGSLRPLADGDPQVHLHDVAVGGSYLEGKARDTIRKARDAALISAGPQLQQALSLQETVRSILAGITPAYADVQLTGVEIRGDGVLVPGTVGLAPTDPVVVTQGPRGGYLDALGSWIPGGTVERYLWGRVPVQSPIAEEHRFVTDPIATGPMGGFCLRVEGTRVTAGGGVAPVSAYACYWSLPIVVQVTELSAETPPSERPLLPLVEPVDEGVRVVGHVDPWAPGRVPARGHANLLVHFGSSATEEAKVLAIALKGRDAPVVTIGVVPEGSAPGIADGAVVVADDGGRWAKAFGVSERGAVLVGPDGEVSWRQEGAVSAAALKKALDAHAHAEGEVAYHVVRLAVGVDDRPPDVPLRLADGREMSLRRLRGRSVILTFCSPASAPSLDHLEHLRDLPRKADPPLVVAVCDDADPERVAEIAAARRIPYLVLPDAGRRIASAFGVWAWPSTVWIRADGLVEAVDVGTLDRSTAQVSTT
jgi:peroxiredoxin